MQDWYLMTPNTRPNIASGFETDSFNDYKDDGFQEILDSGIGTTVILYNYDLSKNKHIKCIIQGNLADTQLKSMERSVLVPIGTLKSGDYIFFEDEFWIVDGRPGNNAVYEKAPLKECQYKLRWQKNDGKVIERWASSTSASKYDVGEGGNNTIILSSNNFTIVIPHDSDSLTIDGKRVFIDSSDVPEKVFKITRNDDVLFMHGNHGGTLSLIADKSELNLSKDRQDLRLCDYIEINNIDINETQKINACISCKGNQELKIGGSTKTIEGCFVTNDGNKTSDIGNWELIATDDLFPYIQHTINDNILKIKILENDLSNSKIRVVFSNSNGTISTYLDFQVSALV